MAASGALAYDGKGWPWEWPLRWIGLLEPQLFTVVTKTLTLEPRKGNLRMRCPWQCIRFIKGGTVNAVGLTNPGIDWWCRVVGPQVNGCKLSLIGSIWTPLDKPDELVTMAQKLNDFDLVGLELNASCPNTDEKIAQSTGPVVDACKGVKDASRHPLILKLSVMHDVAALVPQVEQFVEAFSINSVPWNVAFPSKKSPLARFGGGGVSGKPAQRFTWPLVQRLKHITAVPVIGPSVWEYGDIVRLRELGADAISFGSMFLRYPWRPTRFVLKDIAGRR